MQKPVKMVVVQPPPEAQQVRREAGFVAEGEKRSRYSMPSALTSASPVGYRHRLAFSQEQVEEVERLLSISPPTAFVAGEKVSEQEMFDELSLGVLSSRQSTNFRGHQQLTLGPEQSQQAADILRKLIGREGPVLENAAYTHVVLSRPYRTPFTLLLTFVGHKPLLSMLTVPLRGLRKRLQHLDDIPTIGFLPHLHIGILADSMERAAVIASAGKRQANIFMAPFGSPELCRQNKQAMGALERLINMPSTMKNQGWRIRLVAQVGQTPTAFPISAATCRRVGANLLAFRSERIQPGVNQEKKAPQAYQERQSMDVSEEFTFMAARAAYNAFCRWSGCVREHSKDLLLLERVDVRTPNGKSRLREIREQLGEITDRVVQDIPLWADLPLGKALSKNAARGRKAFALAGQRIYIGGLDKQQIQASGIDWVQAIQAVGAAAARSALYCELAGCVDLPDSCDLLTGMCLMAGPVNQNDIGKQFYGYEDLLQSAFPQHDPTSLLVWTLKAKTVADPIGNEEQLLNPKRKGALVDLRCGPHEITFHCTASGIWKPFRKNGKKVNEQRAFAEQDNFVTDAKGKHIPGNTGTPWPQEQASAILWDDS